MSLKLFREFGTASRDEATIRSRGNIFLSNAIARRAGNGDSKSARLYYDEENERLGIELLGEYEKGDKSQRKVSKENSGISVNAAALFKYFGYELGEKKSAPIEIDQNMVIIDVSKMPKSETGEEMKGE